ncbi:hypothetical protein L3C95_19115 [Chitinophaga filiformis]|uniref:hypothetical protein n=1 Tax=Chitinophaga filiformis TaxID=104663 RepID=UPI001F1E326F|nr:hypothetical protein [Chitinophaga filiformis]MCF6405020.1 hypothetical protein [Chitinophaga filiformis]
MKIFLSLSALVLTMNACNMNDVGKRNLNIPDKIEMTKTSLHRQIPGTRLFMVVPSGYKISKSRSLVKDNGTEILILDSPGRAFGEGEDKVSTSRLQNSKEITFYEKDFIIGSYEANIRYGKIKKEKREKIVFKFGDAEFTGAAICTLPDNNREAREEIIAALLTIFFDKSINIDYAALNNYSLDTSKSVFKFNKNSSLIFYYTADGKGDIDNNYVAIVRGPALPNLDYMRGASKELVRRMKDENGVTIDHIEENVVNIKGQPAYESIMRGIANGTPDSMYLLLMGNETSSIFFMGMIDENKALLFNECKALAQTIQLK